MGGRNRTTLNQHWAPELVYFELTRLFPDQPCPRTAIRKMQRIMTVGTPRPRTHTHNRAARRAGVEAVLDDGTKAVVRLRHGRYEVRPS